jgi:uncharacterized protein
MTRMIYHIVNIFGLFCTLAVSAQPVSKHLKTAIIAKGYEDSVVIRWAPADPQTWLLGNETGYHLSRIDLSIEGHPVRSDLGPALFLPMPEKQLLAGLDTSDQKTKYITVAEKMLYAKQYSTLRTAPRSFMQEAKGQHGALVLRYSVAMMAADYSPAAAEVLGLRFVDHQVRSGGKYVYQLSCNAQGRFRIDSASVFVLNTKAKKEPVPQGLEAFGFDRKIEVRWLRRQEGNFSGFYLERSDDDGVTWHSLTKAAYNSGYVPPTGDTKKDSILAKGKNSVLRDQQVFTDSVAQNNKPYQYRLRAVNGFGEISGYCAPVVIRGRDLTPPIAPLIDSAKNIAGNHIKLWWRQVKTSADLAAYIVERGSTNKGPFIALSGELDKHTHVFTDTTAQPHQGNFYVVLAVDSARNLSASAPVPAFLTDTTPPLAPVGLTGIIDSNGLVRLEWNGNTEDDLLGYQVYASVNPNFEFSQVTHTVIKDHRFTDTVAMNSLDRHMYYRVRALDKSYNHSHFSSIAELKKPVLIPPTAPVAGQIVVSKKRADIEWIESRSEGAIGYEVFRKEAGKDWQALGRLQQDWTMSSLHFVDTTIAANTDYYYAAETLDSSGLRSARSFAVHVKRNTADSLPALTSLAAKLNNAQRSIQLTWEYQDTGDYFFVLYRSVNNGIAAPWQSFEKTTRSASDPSVKNGVYSYAIKVVYRDRNVTSVVGKAVVVNVNN